MGYAGNVEPNYIIPTAIGVDNNGTTGTGSTLKSSQGVNDLDFYIGNEVCQTSWLFILCFALLFLQSSRYMSPLFSVL